MEEKLNSLTMSMAFLVSLGIAAVYYFVAYNTGEALESSIASLEQSYAANQSEIERVRTAIQDAERYQQTMATLGSEMERVQKAIPSALTSQDMMKLLSNEAKVVGAEINQITASQSQSYQASNPDTPPPLYEPVTIEINLTGTYNQLMLFLSNLTKSDKIISAKKLNLNISQGRPTNSTTPIIEMRATIEAYKYLPPPANTGASGA